MTHPELKKLLKLLRAYGDRIRSEQPLAASVIALVCHWIHDDIEETRP